MHYIGDFNDNGEFHGYGILKHDDGSVYHGEWSNGKRHGYGTYIGIPRTVKGYTYTVHNSYEGNWDQDTIDGAGILLRYTDTGVCEYFDGYWDKNMFIGTVEYQSLFVLDSNWTFKGYYTQSTFWDPDVIETNVYGRGERHLKNSLYYGEVANSAVAHGLGIDTSTIHPMQRGVWNYSVLVVDADELYESFIKGNDAQKIIFAKVLHELRLPAMYLQNIDTMFSKKEPNIIPEIDVLSSPTHYLKKLMRSSSKEQEERQEVQMYMEYLSSFQ
jgi:hypothetical protein